MDDKDLLDIPEFLKREIKDTETIIEEDTPDKEESWKKILREHREDKERRALRRKRKQHVDNFVMDAVRWKQDTYGKIRKFIYEDVADNEIKSALKRLLKNDRLIKPSSRTYKVR